MFYYEISLKIGTQIQQSAFYNSLSYNKNVILKFLRENFSFLTNIFFTDNSLEENTKAVKNMDICFEDYVYNTKDQYVSTNNNETLIKIKKEILNILSFLIDNYQEYDSLHFEIKKIMTELLDLVINTEADIPYIENIKQICKKFFLFSCHAFKGLY
jgi:hypothetical protein